MHGQGNYTTQIGKDPYARPPAFQQHPAAPTTSSTSHYGPRAPQLQVYQQVQPSFQPTLSFNAFQHAPPSAPHHGPPAPVVSGGLSSVQSYLPHSRPPHLNTQISQLYPFQEQHSLPWSRNAHQLPPAPPLPGPSAYQLPSLQGHTLERAPSLQSLSHATPTSISDPFGSSVLPMREHSHQQSMAPVLPPPPPPPPPSSPPGVPPIPPSSPPSDTISKRDKGLLDGNNLMMECPTPVEYRSTHDIDFSFQEAEKSGSEVGQVEFVVAHSPADSDMDMEDDITHPDEEKKNKLSINSNDECVSKSLEDYAKEQLQSLPYAGGHGPSENVIHGNILFAEDTESKAERGGSEIASDCNFPVPMKVTSEADDSGMSVNGQTEHPLNVRVEDFHSQHKNLSQPCPPVLSSENGNGKFPDQAMEGANPFKLLQDYTSDNTSETDEEIVTNVGSHSANYKSTNFDAEKGCDSELELRHETVAESNKHISSKLVVESPGNVIQDDNGLEGANLHKLDAKSNPSKLNVDEFGRLVREGVSDSDTSGSPHHAPRHARNTRKRSRSRSRSRSRTRSRSPHDRRRRRRRRRRSPRRRKEGRSLSRSLSLKRRRSRSRSPVLRRDGEFRGDKFRWEKGHIPECFDFRRGKCYRGATCRYSHHELDESERSRYKRGKQHYHDALPNLKSPDFREESKALPDKKAKDKGLGLPEDMPGSKEAKDVERLPVHFSTDSPSKDQSFVPEVAAPYSDEIPRTVYEQGKRTDSVSESSTPAHAFAARSTHHPADKPNTKPYSSEEVTSHSLKEPLPSIVNHSPQLTFPFPSALQAVSAPLAQPITQDYNLKPPISWDHMIPENNSPYQAPVSYQHSHFPGPSKSLSSSFLPLSLPLPPPPPPPLPPPPAGEHTISSQNMQQPLLPPWIGLSSFTSVRAQPTELPYRTQTGQYQGYPFARESNQMPHNTDSFGSSSLRASNLTSGHGGPHIPGEDRLSGHSVLMQPPLKGMHSSVAGGLPSDSFSHSHPYFQQSSYGMQYPGTGTGVPAQHSEPGMVNSSASRINLDFVERNRPSYVREESRNSNYLNAYASTFDLPPSSKFSSNALIQENDTTIKSNYSASTGLSPAPVDEHKTKDGSVLPRPGGNQYDPYFDSIEPASNSFSKADYRKHETGDSDDVLRFSGSGRMSNMEVIKQEGKTSASANELEKEECGETADVLLDGVLDGTPSNHDDATDTDAGEVEIDQVKTSGKKKKGKERSMKLFKVSIATFVKEVLKPSWRQGNMSKEAFKTIVKKTVDKVSGAMKSHQIPKSQAKINHYIDSSRGKLTKLVMGYVDKYVKV